MFGSLKRESPNFTEALFWKSLEPSGCRFWVCPHSGRPQKHLSIHVMTCSFPSLLKPLSVTKTRTQTQRPCPDWVVLCGVSAQRQRWWCMNTCQQLNRHFTWSQCVCSAGQHKQALFCRHNERNVTSNCLLDAPYVIISSYIPSTHKNKTRNAQHGLYL